MSGGVGRGVEKAVEERVAAEAGVALAAVGIEDPELCPPPRRAVAAAGDGHLRPLPDDVAPEPDPPPTDELEPEAGRFGDCRRKGGRYPRRLEDDEEGLRPSGEGGQPMEPIRQLSWSVGRIEPGRQVDDEEIDRPTAEQRPGDGEALVDRCGCEDDEPLEVDPPGDRLDRVEAPPEVHPGDDRARRLRLCRESQGERRPAARAGSPEREGGRPGDAARPEDRVELGEAGRDDALL
jgi:hypothetical protein